VGAIAIASFKKDPVKSKLNRSVNGRVSQIIPAADPSSRNFTVKIALTSHADVIPGMFGRLQLTTSDRQALMIPNNAIVKRMGITGAYKVVDGKAQFQTLTTGAAHDIQVEIFSGLKSGDRHQRLLDKLLLILSIASD
jgi:multidrug efflux pump subunit AcrA (membrane-fusion protein)